MDPRSTPAPATDGAENRQGSKPRAEPRLTDARTSADWAGHIRVHQHRVVLSLVASGFSFERATELAHEAWTRLIEKHRSGRLTELKLPGLAIVQARFLAWQERRREGRSAPPGREAEEETEELLVDRNPTPEQRVLTRQQAERALATIAGLPPNAQKVFRLLYGERPVSHTRAAEVLGLSLQRVRQILCELRKAVRLALEEESK